MRIKKESGAWLPHIRYGVGGAVGLQAGHRRAAWRICAPVTGYVLYIRSAFKSMADEHTAQGAYAFAPSFGGFVFIESLL